MRRAEFARLAGTVYADHAGTTLYSDRQLRDIYQARGLPLPGSSCAFCSIVAVRWELKPQKPRLLLAAECC